MDNMINTEFKRKLTVPQEIKKQYPLSAEAVKVKEAKDAAAIAEATKKELEEKVGQLLIENTGLVREETSEQEGCEEE